MAMRRSSVACMLLLLSAGAVSMSAGCAGGGSTTEQGADGDASIDTGSGGPGPFGNDSGPGPTNDAGPGLDTGGGQGGDAGPKQPCSHNQDCLAPNLCAGNNGYACLGGFCIPTGKPMNCDDGVACTEDSCDANQNKCTHKANDATCPNGSFCDSELNCVQQLPCSPGDSVCDRLNTSAC